MARADQAGTVSVAVRDMGGIDAQEVTFDRGVTVLTGRNATNRTSLLQSISAGLGGTDGELKSDADDGEVTLTVDGEQYTRRFERRDGAVQAAGDAYADEAAIVDLFACLLETNPARQAVERGDGDALRDIIMRPVDTEDVQARIEERRTELREVEGRIDEIERRRGNLAALTERRERLAAELDEVEAELDDVRETVAEFEADPEDAEAAEAVLDELRETREEYERVRDELDTQRNALSSLETDRDATREELEETAGPDGSLDDAKAELERLQREKRDVENTINSLVSIVEFNDDLVDGGLDGLGDDDGVVDELDPMSGTVECWTCGTNVERRAIADRIDDLRDVVAEKREARDDLADRIDDKREAVADLREQRQKQAGIKSRLGELETEIEDRTDRIETLTDRREALDERIDDLEAEAAESERLRDSDLLEAFERRSELEYERGQLEEQLDAVREEIETIESLESELESKRARREELGDELDDLRGRIEDLERSAVEVFNEQMETVLSLLDYENVARVWIERLAAEGEETGTFELHVVRSAADGAVYEDTVDHLSESEREVIGLVVALAGYLVHDVHESVPVMVLDSLEAIDADRIAALVDYFSEYAPYLVVALLPEDAQALSEEYDRVAMGGAVA